MDVLNRVSGESAAFHAPRQQPLTLFAQCDSRPSTARPAHNPPSKEPLNAGRTASVLIMTSEDQDPTSILQRMVLEVFGERDAARRAAAVQELFASDATFSDAEASVTGHAAIDAAAGRILAGAPPEYAFTIVDGPQAIADLARVSWHFGPTADAPAVRGTDIALIAGDRITRLYTFLEPST
jgi:hypothetical protein